MLANVLRSVGRRGRLVAGLGLLLAAASVAWACRTPVYRYAMYNSAPAPYRVFCFAKGPLGEEDRKVQQALRNKEDDGPQVNAVFQAVDPEKKEQLDRLPDLVRKAWQAQPAGKRAKYLVFTPLGAPLHAGTLTPQAVRQLVESPARHRLGQLLHAGNAGVLVLLTGKDAARNREIEKLIDVAALAVSSGQVAVTGAVGGADAPEAAPAAKMGDDNGDARSQDAQRNAPLKIARLTVSRTDPAESWLVRMLMLVEPDLEQYADEPLVYAVYGRGRAMPPLAAKGINADNLEECVSFLAGACSCQLKDENPGVDLLMRWNWEATAERLAAEDDNDDGGQIGYREVTPGAAGKTPAPPSGAAAEIPPRLSPEVQPPAAASQAHANPKPEIQNPIPSTPSPAGAEAVVHERQIAMSANFLNKQLWLYGGGLGLAVVVMVLAGWIVTRGGQG